jgi:hypothetical protein
MDRLEGWPGVEQQNVSIATLGEGYELTAESEAIR